MTEYTASTYGDRIAARYDEIHAHLPHPGAMADMLARLAEKGRALELGIGTGRVALPLAALGVEVHGVDASEAMVAELRRKPGGPDIPVTMSDFANFSLDVRYDLVFVVFNTFFSLSSQEAQTRCFEAAARHLNAGGVFVIEAFVPDVARLARGNEVSAEIHGASVLVDLGKFDANEQRVNARHLFISESGIEMFPVQLRYAWPGELDLMARLAGLRLRERWADWAGSPFTSSSKRHVSVYEKSTADGERDAGRAMADQPTFGDFALGLEGLAILRAWSVDPATVVSRADSIASIVERRGEAPWSAPVPVSERSIVSGYTEWAPTYDDQANPIVIAEQAAVRAVVERYPVGAALDAACGTGRHAAYLASLGYDVTGIDATPAMLETARATAAGVRFEVGRLESIPLGDASVDLAVCALALTHLPDPAPAIEELARVVRPGGRVVVSDVHPFSVMLGAQAGYRQVEGSRGFVRNYVHLASDYLSWFAAAGLRVVRCMEPRWGAEELATFGAAGIEIGTDLLEAAIAGTPAVIVWETVRD